MKEKKFFLKNQDNGVWVMYVYYSKVLNNISDQIGQKQTGKMHETAQNSHRILQEDRM